MAGLPHPPMIKQIVGEKSNEATSASTVEQSLPHLETPTFSNSQPLLITPEKTKTPTEISLSKDNKEPDYAPNHTINTTNITSNDTTNQPIEQVSSNTNFNTISTETAAKITNSATTSVTEMSAASQDSDGIMPEFHKPNEKKPEKDGRRLFLGSLPPTLTVATSLIIVLGVFFIFAWLMKRATPRQNGLLPKEVFEKLGSVTFSPKMQMQLLRLGGKLVLVSVTPDGMSPVAEVTDPDEVIHLISLCKQSDPKSSSMMFRQVLKQYTGENGVQQQKQILSPGYQQQQPQQLMQQQYPPQNIQQTVRRPVGIVTPTKVYQK
jgi:flagellar biogenesis protein FliO